MDTSRLILVAKNLLKKDSTVKDMFKEYQVDIREIDLIPICFVEKLEVSARTEHGIIYLNKKLLPDFLNKNLHYLVHEITHFLQQTTGNSPTKGSTEDNYLENEYEQEGFQNQTKYISDQKSPEKAEKYVQKVMDHHKIPEKEREDLEDDLLRTSSIKEKQLNLFKRNNPELSKEELKEKTEQLLANFKENLAEIEPAVRVQKVKILPEFERKYRIKQIKNILDNLK